MTLAGINARMLDPENIEHILHLSNVARVAGRGERPIADVRRRIMKADRPEHQAPAPCSASKPAKQRGDNQILKLAAGHGEG